MADNKDQWVDKYEPKTLDEICGQEELVAAFKAYVKRGFIPNMTLGGSPGIGKTLIVKCFANDMGLLDSPGRFYMFNASDDNGIAMVRTTLREIAEKPTIDDEVKLIVMDEGDGITDDAQGAMRGLIQNCSGNARFILTGNYPEEFIAAINSRCPLKVVMPLTKEAATKMIRRIQNFEKFNITQDAIDALFEICEGDMRLLINKLQDADICSNRNIERHHIISVEVTLETAKKILEIAQTDFVSARQVMTTTYQSVKNMKMILKKLYKAVDQVRFDEDPEKNEIKQLKLRDKIADMDYISSQGITKEIQLDNILNYIRLLHFIPLSCPKVR